jgi:hypothetical protein
MTGILAKIDSEIRRLEQVRAILTGKDSHRGSKAPAPASPQKKRRLSAEARARISAAQKARWARNKKAAK